MNKKNDLSKVGPIKTDEYFWAKAAFKDPLFKKAVKNISVHDQLEVKEMANKFQLRESDIESYILHGKTALESPPGIIVSSFNGKSDTINIQITRDFRKENLSQCWPIIESALKTLPGYKKSLKPKATEDLPYAIFRAIKFYNFTPKEVYVKMQEGELMPNGKALNTTMDYSDFYKYYKHYVKGKLDNSL